MEAHEFTRDGHTIITYDGVARYDIKIPWVDGVQDKLNTIKSEVEGFDACLYDEDEGYRMVSLFKMRQLKILDKFLEVFVPFCEAEGLKITQHIDDPFCCILEMINAENIPVEVN
ncbi:hypothetical protein [Neptuniibacter sp. QD37_11]|uniref:hypothetical protein n=1 Tax=Neptuniibacter sp. QD37_11 TaxID=3398209 RepID=UPI0039F502E8